MLELKAKKREIFGDKLNKLRDAGKIPAVVYGNNTKSTALEIDAKEFSKIYKEAGYSSLIALTVDGKKVTVLIHDIDTDSMRNEPIHVDFYVPNLKEEVEATVALVFEGEAGGVKNFGGTLVKNIKEIDVKALPENLPHEIIVQVDVLENIGDHILIKDLILPKGVTVSRDPEETVAYVAEQEKEEEIETPTTEEVTAATAEPEKTGEKKE